MSTEQPSDVSTVSRQDIKHPYIPLSARKVERGRNYASTMVNDQKTMLENLRFLRHQMDKEERQLKIMSDTLYKRSLPHRDRLQETPVKSAVTSSDPLPPPQPTPRNTSIQGKHRIKSTKNDLTEKNPLPALHNNPEVRKKLEVNNSHFVKTKPIHMKADVGTDTWSKEAEARWLKRYMKFLSTSTGDVRPAGKDQVDNGRALTGRSILTSEPTRSWDTKPSAYRVPEVLNPRVLEDIIQETVYEKNGRRFHNYSGLGEDGQWLLQAIDCFYNDRFGGY